MLTNIFAVTINARKRTEILIFNFGCEETSMLFQRCSTFYKSLKNGQVPD